MRLVSGLSVAILTTALSGCTGNLIDIIPKIKDASAGLLDIGIVDLGPPKFIPDIQNDIDNIGGMRLDKSPSHCADTSACHQAPNSVNAPILVYMPTNDNDRMANYMAFMAQCDSTNPTQSIAIVNPSDPTSGHTGGLYFSNGGEVYNRWVAWISQGMVYQ